MSIAKRIQTARLRHAQQYPGQGRWRCYVGGVELLNPDGATPVIKQMGVTETMGLIALSGATEDVAFWRVRHMGTEQPVSAAWSLSLDGGVTTFPVQCTRRETKTADTDATAPCFEYFLRGNG